MIVTITIIQNFYRDIKGHVHITKGKCITLKFNNICGIFKLHCNQVHMNLQNRGAYYYNFFIYIKIIPFFVEKTAEPAFVVVVVVYYYMLLFCLSL